MELEGIGTPWLWGGFIAFVLAMLGLDLGVFNRKTHEVRVREAAAAKTRQWNREASVRTLP